MSSRGKQKQNFADYVHLNGFRVRFQSSVFFFPCVIHLGLLDYRGESFVSCACLALHPLSPKRKVVVDLGFFFFFFRSILVVSFSI